MTTGVKSSECSDRSVTDQGGTGGEHADERPQRESAGCDHGCRKKRNEEPWRGDIGDCVPRPTMSTFDQRVGYSKDADRQNQDKTPLYRVALYGARLERLAYPHGAARCAQVRRTGTRHADGSPVLLGLEIARFARICRAASSTCESVRSTSMS